MMPCTMTKRIGNEPMESHGVRMLPGEWKRVDALAQDKGMSRSEWVRVQIAAALALAPEVHNQHRDMPDMHEDLYQRVPPGRKEAPAAQCFTGDTGRHAPRGLFNATTEEGGRQ